MTAHLKLMAHYNQWMNQKIIALCEANSEADFWEDRGAYFGSVMGSLNHILVGDLLWLRRLSHHPAGQGLLAIEVLPQPQDLNDILYHDFSDLKAARFAIDAVILAFIDHLTEVDLSSSLSFRRVNGDKHTKALGLILMHLFNHQTHHRGQITTLLSQMGLDIGDTDVLVIIPEA
jgi:uncharacterized damage-inducible protein DinB